MSNEVNETEQDIITMIMEDGSEIDYVILESTTLGGVNYILVTDPDEGDIDEDGYCYIMKDVSTDGDQEAVYESVDGEEADSVFEVFRQLLDGEIDIEK